MAIRTMQLQRETARRLWHSLPSPRLAVMATIIAYGVTMGAAGGLAGNALAYFGYYEGLARQALPAAIAGSFPTWLGLSALLTGAALAGFSRARHWPVTGMLREERLYRPALRLGLIGLGLSYGLVRAWTWYQLMGGLIVRPGEIVLGGVVSGLAGACLMQVVQALREAADEPAG